jgi:hypothetical protein
VSRSAAVFGQVFGLGLALGLAACRREPVPARAPVPSAPGDRQLLLQKIAALDEVAPCFADAGSALLRLVDAEVAGDAARVTFACVNGAASGKVTFFRLGGAWTISTKEIAARR